eukprot:scaffold975_cov90-Cylindrotheca_fusiformis.AAC.5
MSTSSTEMWRSKLGTNYPKEFMKQNEKKFFAQLQSLRKDIPENRNCADCHSKGSTMWASVNLGVFLCMTCGSHHRSLGTHISIPKGCTGTYWWGPDELESMKNMGNQRAAEVYGTIIPNGLSNTDVLRWKQYLTDKYVHRKYAGNTAVPTTSKTIGSPVQTRQRQETDLIHFRGSSPNAVEGDDFFANFGEQEKLQSPKITAAIPNCTTTRRSAENTVGLLDLRQGIQQDRPSRTSISSPEISNKDFFADFGL